MIILVSGFLIIIVTYDAVLMTLDTYVRPQIFTEVLWNFTNTSLQCVQRTFKSCNNAVLLEILEEKPTLGKTVKTAMIKVIQRDKAFHNLRCTCVFSPRGWKPHLATTVERTKSGVLKGTKPFGSNLDKVQLIRAISRRTASFFR